MYEIAIVILSYNKSYYLKNCLQSIFDKNKQNKYFIVIVDDASTDKKVKNRLSLLKEKKNIQIIQNDQNLGFSKSVNIGVTFIKNKYEMIKYILILNQDTVFLDNTLNTAINLLREREDIGICGPKLLNPDGSIQNSFYAFPSVLKKLAQLVGLRSLGKFFCKTIKLRSVNSLMPNFATIYLKNYEELKDPIEVPWLCGACLIIRKELFEELNGFDENFRMYSEDMDFCQRARKEGWKIYFIPGSQIIHYGYGKPQAGQQSMLDTYYDSLANYYKKHYAGLKRQILLLLNRVERWK